MLPWRIAPNILAFLLTSSGEYITGLEPLDIKVQKDTEKDPDAFSIEVKGVDEYTSKKEWDKVWKDKVEPLQRNLFGLRGILPNGRKFPRVGRLSKGLGIYQEVVIKGVPISDVINWGHTEWELEAARRVIQDIRHFIEPEP